MILPPILSCGPIKQAVAWGRPVGSAGEEKRLRSSSLGGRVHVRGHVRGHVSRLSTHGGM